LLLPCFLDIVPAMSRADSATAGPRQGGRRAEEQAPLRPFLFLALAVFLWSGNWVVGRALRDTMPPIALNFWRWFGAALILAPLVLPRLAGRWHRVLRHWRILALLGGTGAALFQTLVYFGLAMTTTVNAVLMNSSMPLFIILCAWLLDRERATARQIAGICVSLLGILIIMRRGDFGHLLQLEANWGDFVILAAMPVWGIYSVLLRRRPVEFTGNELLFLLALAALVWLTPLVVIETIFIRSGTLTAASLAAVAYVSLFASVIGYVCWNKGVAAVGANRAGVTVHLLPAFGTILAILFLGEEFHLFHLLGIATILAGVWLAASARSP
jgi:drug/metabolite transporter (DMT)-like permease